jgi:putative addiction module component (TIGR02574 family)
MNTPQSNIDIKGLSRDERIMLAEELWDSVTDISNDLPITEAQKNMLNERLAHYHAFPNEGFTWEQIKEEMK